MPFSGIEATIIAQKLKTKARCREAASKQELKKNCHAKVIHISTHGFSDYTTDNWLSHGIVMAGAENWLQKEQSSWSRDNGILTADEITRLNLSGTNLFVLSACSSGLEAPGESSENSGLRTALQIAGAQYVISSLWDLYDFSCA